MLLLLIYILASMHFQTSFRSIIIITFIDISLLQFISILYTQMHHCFGFCIKMFFISNNNNSITESKQRRVCARQLYKRQFCVVVIINIIAEVHYYYKRGMRGDNNKIENIIHINFIKRKIIINFCIIYIYTNFTLGIELHFPLSYHLILFYIFFIIISSILLLDFISSGSC